MKTILDVSVLGQGFYHQKARTGIFRVAENLAIRLPQISNDLEVFYADHIDLLSTIGYFDKNLPDNLQKFVNTPSHISLAEFQNHFLKHLPLNSLPQKAIRKMFYKLNSKKIELVENSLNDSDIYHSPFFLFPNQVQTNKKIKKLITIHDLIPIKYPQYFEDKKNNIVHQIIKTIKPDTYVTCISEATKNDFLEVTGFSESQVSVVPLAASSKLFYPVLEKDVISKVLEKYAITNSKTYFLSISTLEPRKNIHTLIKSFANLIEQEKNEELQLVLVGTKGWDFDKIFERIDVSPSIKDKIIFTGYVPDQELAMLYSGAIGFMYLSFCEGFGLPPLEAMQCGTPVICSNTTSMPEVVGEAGILVNPTDTDAISQAMLAIYQNCNFREELRLNSIQRAKLFSWEKFSSDTYEVYKNIL
jgi:glycosyltransferase involved in cell wall biosynthesis